MVCRIRGSFRSRYGFLGEEGRRPAPFATSYVIDQNKKKTNNRTMIPNLKANTAAGCYGLVKKELLHGAGLLSLEK